MAHLPLTVTVELVCSGPDEPVPNRLITLRAPKWSIGIGRGPKPGSQAFTGDKNNARFESKVMSKSHAILKADPSKRVMTIEDVGSTHGTFIDDRKLPANKPTMIAHGESVRFGMDVTHKTEHFYALVAQIYTTWSDTGNTEQVQTPAPVQTRNSFTADYVDEDQTSDSDVDIIEEITRPSDFSIAIANRTFSVPDSDTSEIEDSVTSSVKGVSRHESPTSSPPDIPHDADQSDIDKAQINGIIIDTDSEEDLHNEAKLNNKTSEDDEYDADEQDAEHLIYEYDQHVPTQTQSGSDYDDSDVFNDNDARRLEIDSRLDMITSSPVAPDDLQIEDSVLDTALPFIRKVKFSENQHLRTPSPSDAALVKKTSSHARSPPPSSNNLHSILFENSEDQDRKAYSGHDQMDYDRVTPTTQLRTNLKDHKFFDIIPDDLVIPWNPMGIKTAYEPRLNSSMDYQITNESSLEANERDNLKAPIAIPRHRKSTVSINDILNQSDSQLAETEHPQSSPSLKRKIEQILENADSYTDETNDWLSRMQAESSKFPDAQPAEEVLVPESISPQAILEDAIFSIKSEDSQSEPPRKKSKRNKNKKKHKTALTNVPSRKNIFARYAATAVAGAVAGVVGTIIGLAALPAEYFE